MKFGLFYLPTYLPAIRDVQTHYCGIIEQVEFADQIGIDYAWIVEHHFVRHGGLFPSNYAFLSYLAARTKRIRRAPAPPCCRSTIRSASPSRRRRSINCRRAVSISECAAASSATNSRLSAST